VSALDIARAACKEVGLDPERVVRVERGGKHSIVARGAGVDRRAYYRALLLSALAVQGPDYPTRCLDCASQRDASELPACLTVREALMGRVCGRTFAAPPSHRSLPPQVVAVEQVGGDAQPPLRVPPADHRSAT
jgi:hypothetical protein